jgi:hypothetical protein
MLSGDSADETALVTDMTATLASHFSVDPSIIVVTAEFTADRRMEGGRRLAPGTFKMSYEIITIASKASAIRDLVFAEADFIAAITALMPSATVMSVSEPTLETVGAQATDAPTAAPTETPGRDGEEGPAQLEQGGAEVARVSSASEADSSSTVIVLGVAAFVVLFIMVLVPTLCRRRLSALFGKKGNNNAVPTSNNVNDTIGDKIERSIAGEKMDWDVDRGAREQASQAQNGDDAVELI